MSDSHAVTQNKKKIEHVRCIESAGERGREREGETFSLCN